MKTTEVEILSRIRQGEHLLFREIVDEFKDKAFSLTFRILKNYQEAEDCLQEAFMRLFNAIKNRRHRQNRGSNKKC